MTTHFRTSLAMLFFSVVIAAPVFAGDPPASVQTAESQQPEKKFQDSSPSNQNVQATAPKGLIGKPKALNASQVKVRVISVSYDSSSGVTRLKVEAARKDGYTGRVDLVASACRKGLGFERCSDLGRLESETSGDQNVVFSPSVAQIKQVMSNNNYPEYIYYTKLSLHWTEVDGQGTPRSRSVLMHLPTNLPSALLPSVVSHQRTLGNNGMTKIEVVMRPHYNRYSRARRAVVVRYYNTSTSGTNWIYRDLKYSDNTPNGPRFTLEASSTEIPAEGGLVQVAVVDLETLKVVKVIQI